MAGGNIPKSEAPVTLKEGDPAGSATTFLATPVAWNLWPALTTAVASRSALGEGTYRVLAVWPSAQLCLVELETQPRRGREPDVAVLHREWVS